jgi:hypothetical protein
MAPIPSLGDGATSQRIGPGIVLTVLYLDSDPGTVAPEVAAQMSMVPTELEGVEVDLYCGPVRTITPWQWDWFDATAPSRASFPKKGSKS